MTIEFRFNPVIFKVFLLGLWVSSSPIVYLCMAAVLLPSWLKEFVDTKNSSKSCQDRPRCESIEKANDLLLIHQLL